MKITQEVRDYAKENGLGRRSRPSPSASRNRPRASRKKAVIYKQV
jgi:hypothetical protein